MSKITNCRESGLMEIQYGKIVGITKGGCKESNGKKGYRLEEIIELSNNSSVSACDADCNLNQTLF